MSVDSHRAVFLSYASQDAEAARRICETLRAGGVEVWFDVEGGLEHGDEWDAKIRRQIKECVLFIPIISVNTQARHEGYFRLEWELAAQRAMSIASGVPFILPVVIDDTREPDALVPDRFRAVQWTKLRGGEVTPEMKARYLKLWSQRIGAVRAQSSASAIAAETSEMTALRAGHRWRKPVILGAAIVAALAIVGFGSWRAKIRPGSPTGDSVSQPPTQKTAPGSSEVQEKLRQMWQIYEKNNDASREDWALAEELGASAVKLENNNADAWAAYSVVTVTAWLAGCDFTDAHFNDGMSRAERALSLDPTGISPRFAYANGLRMKPATRPEGERILRELIQQVPADKRILRTQAAALRMGGKFDEALTLIDRAIALPGGDVAAMFGKFAILREARRETEAQAVIDQILALRPSPYAYLWKAFFQVSEQGDLDQARAALEKIPPNYLRKDDGAYFASRLWLWRRDYERSAATLSEVTQDFLLNRFTFDRVLGEELRFFLTGQAHLLAGRKTAAEIDWRSGLKKIEQRLAAEPSQSLWYFWKARLLASLGERAEAERALEAFRQLAVADADTKFATALVLVPLGRRDEALDVVSDALRDTAVGASSVRFLRTMLRYDPTFDSMRGNPRFDALVSSLFSAGGNRPAGSPSTESSEREKSVAVLPFANQSADKDNEYFSDGIAEELLTVLQKIPGLRVAARASAWSFKGKNPTIKEVGEKLGMAHVVEGSVQKSGNHVKITARLSRAAKNEEVWSKSFGPLELTDVFATQSEIAQAIVGELRGRLTGESANVAAAKAEIQAQVQASAKGGTKNVEAHQLFLQGKFFAIQFSRENIARAIGNFRRATDLDSSFALAWAELSSALTLQGAWGMTDRPLPELFGEARRAAERALDLEPNLAEGHGALSLVRLRYDLDWKGAAAAALRALDLAPSDATIISNAAQALQAIGQTDRAIDLARQAVTLDPLNTEARIYLGYGYWSAGKFKEAEQEYRRVLDLNPAAHGAQSSIGSAVLFQGRIDEAAALIEREPDPVFRNNGLALVRWAQKRVPEADVALQAAIARADIVSYQVAETYAYRNDLDQAFAWLERARENHDSGLGIVRTDLLLRPLHSDPRWPAFLRKIGLHDEQLK